MKNEKTMPAGVVVLLLSLLIGIQPVATDLYLPALPALMRDFGAPVSQAQLTLTALLLPFGISQLAWGPLSDRYGRKPVLIAGLAAYTLASIGSAFSAGLEQLIAWRALQGVGMGASVMCGRAVIRDLYQPVEGARIMSKSMTGLGLIAVLSAPTGGWLASALGWRVALASLGVFGAVALAAVLLRFSETLARPDADALRPAKLLSTWRAILSHPTFWAYTLASGTSYGGLFIFLAASSFVFIDTLGLSKGEYGLTLLSMASIYIFGTFACRWLLHRLGPRRSVGAAALLSLSGGTALGLLAWSGEPTFWGIIAPYSLFIMAHGVHQSCGQSGSVSPFPQSAGAASAWSGFLMMVLAFGSGQWLSAMLKADPAAAPAALSQGIWFWSVLLAINAWTLVRRYGEPRKPPQRQG